MMLADYLLELMEACSDEAFGQEAVEFAVLSDAIPLTYHLDTDLRTIMGEPGKPKTGCYDRLCEEYRRYSREQDHLTTAFEQELLQTPAQAA